MGVLLGVFERGWSHVAGWNGRVTAWADKVCPSFPGRTEKQRLLAILVASGANVMGRLYALHEILQGVVKTPGAIPLKTIAKALYVPVLHLHTLAFKFTYALQRRYILGMCRSEADLQRVQVFHQVVVSCLTFIRVSRREQLRRKVIDFSNKIRRCCGPR